MPTTIDLHGAKPIDLDASNPEAVAEDLLESDVVLSRREVVINVAALAFTVAGIAFVTDRVTELVAGHTLMQTLGIASALGRMALMITVGAIATVTAILRWRTLTAREREMRRRRGL